MKKTRKIFAVVLALVMCLAMAVPAMAASITIVHSATASAAYGDFRAYKVLDAEKLGDNQVVYTVPDELVEFYTKRYPKLKPDDPAFAYNVAQKIAEEEDLYAFGDAVLEAAIKNGIVGKTGNHEKDDFKIDGLEPGYYVIKDEVSEGTVSALMLQTITDDETVVIKLDKPTIDKKIDGDADKDLDTTGLVDKNNEAIGNVVPYVITTKVPSMNGYEKYKYVITDTLSAGLSYNENLEITLCDETGMVLETLKKDIDYRLSVINNENGSTTIKIVFLGFINRAKDSGKDITVKYTATLNKDAVIGEDGNPNDVILDYSNDPRNVGEGDDFTDGEVKGTTPKIEVETYVTGLELKKVNDNLVSLTGAKFKVKGERMNQVHVTGSTYTEITDPTTGEGEVYYKLADGTYTTTKSTEETKDQYANDGKTYTRKEISDWKTVSEDVDYEFEVDSEGKLVIEGLAAGTYTITEILAPDGYNILDGSIEVSIRCQYNDDGTCTWIGSYTAPWANGHGAQPLEFNDKTGDIEGLQIVNYAGTQLPSTGGIGTTIFYVVGICLVVGAVVILVTRKRVGKNS